MGRELPLIDQIARLHQNVLRDLGIPTRITSVHRSRDKQKRLYDLYRFKLPGAPRYQPAPPGRSQHEYQAAYDLVALDNKNQSLVIAIGHELGLYTVPGDPPHFQLFDSSTWARLLENPL